MSIIIFCQFSFSLFPLPLSRPRSLSAFLSLNVKQKKERKTKKKKKQWSLYVLKHVDALSVIEQVNNDSLHFSYPLTERTSTLKSDR
jgi:hypothetical protein